MLFSPITIRNQSFKNRIVMSPMCMYSCLEQDGKVTDFHYTHYISRAIGQTGLIMTEATAVQPEGRISPNDLGIWADEHIDGLRKLNDNIHSYGSKTGIQLAHAGRKAVLDGKVHAPSPIRFNDTYKQPQEMTASDINSTIQAFQNAAVRAKEADFDVIEIHAAHGYLLNQFLSPLSNKRTDAYGGNKDNRFRLLRNVILTIRDIWNGPLFVRLSVNEYHEDGNTLECMKYYTKELKNIGVDVIDCSSGGVVPVNIHTYPGYQLIRCEAIKHHTPIKTGAVGLITTGIQAEEILQNNRADFIFAGRALLRNPYWPKACADELNVDLKAPKQYKRGWRNRH